MAKQSARDVPGNVAVAILGADLAVLVLDDVLGLVGVGRFPACSFCFVLGAVAGAERAVSARALVLALAVLVVRLDIALSHRLVQDVVTSRSGLIASSTVLSMARVCGRMNATATRTLHGYFQKPILDV